MMWSFSFPLLALCMVMALFSVAPPSEAVKAHDFKTCAESGFCRRQRAFFSFQKRRKGLGTYYVVDTSTVALDPERGTFQAELRRVWDGHDLSERWTLDVSTLARDMVRVRLSARTNGSTTTNTLPVFPLANHVLTSTITAVPFTVGSAVPASLDLHLSATHTLRIYYKPFFIESRINQQVVAVLNAHRGLHLETGVSPFTTALLEQAKQEQQQKKESTSAKHNDTTEEARLNLESTQVKVEVHANTKMSPLVEAVRIFEDGAGQETFRSFTDTKPYGPRSFGFDLGFPTGKHVFGLAEHATELDLPGTRGADAKYQEPYRLYNLDVFEYDLDTPMALYGAVPYVHVATSAATQVGALVLSAAEMWVDVDRTRGIDTHWMGETGPLDVFLWTAPNPLELHTTYLQLTGTPALPPLFALGYHHSRWSKFSTKDVLAIDNHFDANDLPYDVFWLDIEHTDDKRYFTWHPTLFRDPAPMLEGFKTKGRKIVTIVDPHIKADANYFVSKEAGALDLFVKTHDKNVFHGHCWPGDSNWIDFTQPKATELWATFFTHPANLHGTEVFTWNDMNEPSVFSGPEVTMPKDARHGVYEHRDVHNLYGLLFHRATYLAQLKRSEGQLRPFVLSRAFFIGTQRYGAVWTGDNMATWAHLHASLPMLLSLSVSGIHFCGADVGGFFGNPDTELLVRWYQAAAFQPFFRAHAHIDAKPREPYLLAASDLAAVRDAVRLRYQFMPVLYTAFFRRTSPPMLPLFFEFPDDPHAVRSDAFLLGRSGVMVAPVTTQGAQTRAVYFPGPLPWFRWSPAAPAFPLHPPGLDPAVPAPALPLFVQSGRILFTRDRPRRTLAATQSDPLSAYVFLRPDTLAATGELVLDDGVSTRPGHLAVHAHYAGGRFHATLTHLEGFAVPKDLRVERIVVVHPTKFSAPPLVGTLDKAARICTIKEPGLRLAMTEFSLQVFSNK